jgi:hypothetical protein
MSKQIANISPHEFFASLEPEAQVIVLEAAMLGLNNGRILEDMDLDEDEAVWVISCIRNYMNHGKTTTPKGITQKGIK